MINSRPDNNTSVFKVVEKRKLANTSKQKDYDTNYDRWSERWKIIKINSLLSPQFYDFYALRALTLLSEYANMKEANNNFFDRLMHPNKRYKTEIQSIIGKYFDPTTNSPDTFITAKQVLKEINDVCPINSLVDYGSLRALIDLISVQGGIDLNKLIAENELQHTIKDDIFEK